MQLPTYSNVLEMIGNTPLMAVRRIDTGPCRLFLKLENQNPGGSIKDRVGLYLIEAAERSGALKPGGTLIEATAGNTGLGLALVAAQKGYRLLLVIPDKMSQEKIFHLQGAWAPRCVMTRSDVSKGHPEYYQDIAERLARETPGAYFVNQFGNPANPRAHEADHGAGDLASRWTDASTPWCAASAPAARSPACRASSRARRPKVEMVLADPVGSVLADYVTHRQAGPAQMTPGWSKASAGTSCRRSRTSRASKHAYTHSGRGERSAPAASCWRRKASSPAPPPARCWRRRCATAASRRRPSASSRFVCDSGNKYLSKVYNDYWMLDQGFLEREQLRRPARPDRAAPQRARRGDAWTRPRPCWPRYRRMKLYDVSQLPVHADGRIVGIVDEEDILLEVFAESGALQRAGHAGDGEPPGHRAGRCAVRAADGDLRAAAWWRSSWTASEFQGLITRIDLLNWLRRQA